VRRILWSPRSLRDLESIRAHIAEDSPLYADLVVQRLTRTPERLQQFPESGRVVPERGEADLREVIVRPFRVVYRVGAEAIEIVTVFHASRVPPL
jgi:toxin ParE1/3/4